MSGSVLRLGVLVLVLTATACRFGFDAVVDGADATELEIAPPRSIDGTRLKAWHFGSGTTQFFGGWTDTALGVDCLFSTASDGVLRCMPGYWTDGAPLSFPFPAYRDTACSQPSVFGYLPVRDGVCLAAPAMFRHLDGIYAGAGTTTAQAYVGAGTCQPFNVGAQKHFVLGARIPDAQFVAAVEQDWGTRKLHAREIVAEDGARELGQLVDATSGRDCGLELRPGGVAECHAFGRLDAASRNYQISGVPTKVFADAACQEPAALASTTSTPTVITDRSAPPCGEVTVDEYELGAEIPAAWSYGDGQCQPIGSPWRFYRVGAHRGIVAPLIGQWSAEGTGRLRDVTVVMDGGTQLAYGVHDDQLGTTCEPTQDDQGSWRCLPPADSASEPVHRTANCSDASVLAFRDCGVPVVDHSIAFVVPQPACRTDGRNVRNLVSTTSGLHRATGGGGCAPITESMLLDSGSVPATTFVPLDYRPVP